MPAASPVGTRLGAKLKQDGACIVWTGAVRPGGYGVIGGSVDNRPWYDSPHRIAYTLVKGPIPDGLHIDHLCGNRLCCNPDHLEAVTQAENNRRSSRWAARQLAAPVSSLTLADLVALMSGSRPSPSGLLLGDRPTPPDAA